MLYALRKLIALVFLGGIVWFIYRDLDYLDQPWFMHALGVLAVVFAVFWLIVPLLVVRMRIRKRVAQNRERYGKWLESRPPEPQPLARRSNEHVRLEPGEKVFFHEKGTLYVPSGAGFDAVAAKGRPGDVAFSALTGVNRKIQRVHYMLTGDRLIFSGKTLEHSVPLRDIAKAAPTPGGIVFHVAGGPRLAFTFQNPLIAADVFGRVASAAK